MLARSTDDHQHQRPRTSTCACCTRPAPAAQTVDELDFQRSACAAAQAGEEARLARLLERHPEALHQDGTAGASGYTPLHYAAREGHLGALKLLLARGAGVNATTRSSRATALHRAAFMGHCTIIQVMLSAGADPSQQDADAETALHKAAKQGHWAAARLLLEALPALASVRDKHGHQAPTEAL